MDKLRMCSVCGELAQGYNFCAITCQSCKAFFRRNAYKYEKFKCRFGDICIINEKTRKMCKKCRLKKCFAVGMKKEWILNEEEKLFRRAQIEENRKLKKIKKKTSDESTGSPSSDASNAETIKSGSEEVVNDEEITDYLLQMDNFYTTEPIDTNSNNDNEMSIESIQSTTTDSDTSDESMKVVSYLSGMKEVSKELLIINEGELIDETQIIDCKHRLAVQMHCNALNQINYISCFNSFEIKRLNELTSLCMFQLIPGPKRLKQIMFSSANELMEKAASSFDTSLIKLVERVKSLSAFQSLCQNDQISLIKYSCIEVQLLKWGLFYRHENEVYIMDVDKTNAVILTSDVLKGFKRNMYTILREYVDIFATEFDSDPHILELLMPIVLFNPERPNITNKDMVGLQHQLYLYLLQKYLRIRYGADSDMKFSKISFLLQDLQTLNELHKQNFREVNAEICGPLLREILDFPSNYITS